MTGAARRARVAGVGRAPALTAFAALALCAPVVAAPTPAPPGSDARPPALPAQETATTAGTIRIYRCTDALGHVTLQNDTPCAKGMRQQQQVVELPTPMPAYVPREERMPDIVAAERADERAAIAAAAQAAVQPRAAPPPPPSLYACRTWDNVDYLTEDATPAQRCAPLQVVGVDGGVRADAAACEKVVDQCEAVPAEALCLSWQRRVDEAAFRWKFAGAREDDARRREYELLKATLAHSDCPSR